jgi:mono/diheme cytochrome c family protein
MTVLAQQPLPTPTVDRLAVPVMPEEPTELDIGRSVYYHNCMPCHGDIGQGLTDEWREVWVDDHQNCWGRGCHSGDTIDEGFPIPKFVPAVMGPLPTLQKFSTENELYLYLSETHPPQRPGALETDEYWALTAFLFSESGRLSQGVNTLLPVDTDLDQLPQITPTVDRLAEPTLPANPSQADLGSVAFWLTCMVCHGDRGQGLTEEWRAVAGEEEMNCWQSRCHASNHPPEGFVLPPYAPRIIGTGSLSRFNTAADLHTFILERMPWQAPGMLDEETYWQLTAFLLRANDFNLGSELLSPGNAAQVHLREGVARKLSVVGTETSQEEDIVATADNRFEVDRTGDVPWLGLIGIALAILLLIGAVSLSFSRARRESHSLTKDQNKTE